MHAPTIMSLALLAATALPLGAAKPAWKVAERIEVDRVPSWFPVGFSLLTHGDRQYVAYYDVDHRMTLAARAPDGREWQRQKLDSKVGWDSHNGITMAVDSAGHLHVSGNMHCVPLIYFRTEEPGDITTLRRLPMTGTDEGRCTYPQFLNDANGNMQVYVARFEDGRWNLRVLSDWDKPVRFSGRGAMPFIGIRVSPPLKISGHVWSVSYRHRDYGSGQLAFHEETLHPVANELPRRRTEFPAELGRPEIVFKDIRVRQIGDLGDSGDPKVRYVMKWDVLPPHHDRPRTGPLPPPATLWLYKLVREDD